MIIDKKIHRDAHGRIVGMTERTLTPTEEYAANRYAWIKAYAAKADPATFDPPGVMRVAFDERSVPKDVDVRQALELIGSHIEADKASWAFWGYRSTAVVVARPGDPIAWPAPPTTPAPVPTGRHAGFL